MSTATDRSQSNDAVVVHEPFRLGLPPVRSYLSQLWRRRQFAAEMSRAGMRAAHSLTVLGQVWLVLNPLLLAGVYYMLVSLVSGRGGVDFLAHLLAGLFAFQFFSACVTTGASSITTGGKLLLNTSFPRLLMPFSAVRTGFIRFLPTLLVYGVFHLVSGAPVTPATFLAGFFLVCLLAFAAGVAAAAATLQVYFRDTAGLLPYLLRIWLYVSPVLYYVEDVPERFRGFFLLNPLGSILAGWSDLLVRSEVPSPSVWLSAAAWAAAALVGGSLFFMSREREFAVRI